MFAIIKDFTADKFTDTCWEKAQKKVHFATQFFRFVNSDFPRTKFTHAFYRRLAQTFGHIAHYNQHGFFEHFFSTTEGKVRFLRQTLAWCCPGDPACTYSDVERALQSWLFQNGILTEYEKRLAAETEAAERAELNRLQAKWHSSRGGVNGESEHRPPSPYI